MDVSSIGMDSRSESIYIKSNWESNSCGSYVPFTSCTPTNNFYLKKINFKNRECLDITQKYSTNPYPENETPINITTDEENNMYILHKNGIISVTSKEGKFIKLYPYNYFQVNSLNINNIIFPISIKPLEINRSPFGSRFFKMLIDSKRKIIYLASSDYIYKININNYFI